jgi:hypothetical protein
MAISRRRQSWEQHESPRPLADHVRQSQMRTPENPLELAHWSRFGVWRRWMRPLLRSLDALRHSAAEALGLCVGRFTGGPSGSWYEGGLHLGPWRPGRLDKGPDQRVITPAGLVRDRQRNLRFRNGRNGKKAFSLALYRAVGAQEHHARTCL